VSEKAAGLEVANIQGEHLTGGNAGPHFSADGDRLFRLLVQGVTDYAIYLLDPTGRVATWNAGAERMKGYTAAEIIGQHFSRFYLIEDRNAQKPQTALRTAAETGRFESEGWRVRKDGTRFLASVVVDAIHDDGGQLIGFAKITRDITERVAAETALRESESRFRLLVQSVTDYAIYMLDPEGNITNWNVGGERIKGYRESEIIGRHFSLFYTEEDRKNNEPARALETAARNGRYEREGWRVRKDGSRFWASVVIDPIRDSNGKLIGFAKVTRDMTERKRTEDALEAARAALAQSQKMEAIGQLTGGVAHDFNNLLTIITNALDLLASGRRDEAQRLRIIDSAVRAAERGAKLTQQLLAFARRQPLRAHVHDINAVITGFEAVLRRACSASIVVETALASQPMPAEIDAAQFETALLNLIVNARDAMPDGGKLRITTGIETVDLERARQLSGIRRGECVVVSISDTGTGMSADVISRAFEPFFTTKDVGKGSGLGLSQVYGVMRQSEGHVEIESRLGIGTTVRLYLPKSEAPIQAEDNMSGLGDSTQRTARVLVVEDDPAVLEVTVAMLRDYGYEVLTAPDGPAGLAILRSDDDIDILFTDIVMPRMNGVELAREAVRLRPRLRVLLASGYPASALIDQRSAGDDVEFAFLRKPYRGNELATKLLEMQAA
jgi:PAS domain S-box-containing protein